MQALIFTNLKQPLEFKEYPDPTTTEDYIIVELKAAALNRRDGWITQGIYANIRTPSILGSDGCGVYEGEDVIINPSLYCGDDQRFPTNQFKILGMDEDGTLAEKVAVSKKQVFKKPAHLTVEQAVA